MSTSLASRYPISAPELWVLVGNLRFVADSFYVPLGEGWWRAAPHAAGPWICLDASTAISTGGTGLATSVLSDQEGPVGVAAQCLLVTPRAV